MRDRILIITTKGKSSKYARIWCKNNGALKINFYPYSSDSYMKEKNKELISDDMKKN